MKIFNYDVSKFFNFVKDCARVVSALEVLDKPQNDSRQVEYKEYRGGDYYAD
jgi:hypothetical protein